MIINVKDIDMNNYISWIYSTLLQRVQAAESDIGINGADIARIYDFISYDGQLVYSLNLANEQIPEGSNLNDYIMAGTYYCSGTSIATTIANSPTVYNYKLIVEFITAGFIQQTVLDRMGHRWTRCYTISAETWGDWVCGSLGNITKINLNDNGQLVVTRLDGLQVVFSAENIVG